MQGLAVATRAGKDKTTLTPKTQRCKTRPSSSKTLRTNSKQRIPSHPDYQTLTKGHGHKKSKNSTITPKQRQPSSKRFRSNPSERTLICGNKKPRQKENKEGLKQKYMEIVHKVFKRIDFFGYGWIDAHSINKWIDPKVLYFFGSIFHIIKTQNVKVTKHQFMSQAQKVFQKSSLTDVKYFIETICIDPCFYEQQEEQEVAKIRGAAAVTYAAVQRKKPPPILYDLDYQVDFNSKQTLTPLFSDACLTNHDSNKPSHDKHFNTAKNIGTRKYAYLDDALDMNYNSPTDLKTRPFEVDCNSKHKLTSEPAEILNPSKENSKLLAESRRKLEESKLGRLKERLDYFIQKNSQHLNASQYVRMQNGF